MRNIAATSEVAARKPFVREAGLLKTNQGAVNLFGMTRSLQVASKTIIVLYN